MQSTSGVGASVLFLHGSADRVAPSINLKVQSTHNGAKCRGEYIFGVGEGLSRAMLEHKARPSSDLRAIFAATVSDFHMGGLGGLLLRLRADGHRQVGLCAGAGARLVLILYHFGCARYRRHVIRCCIAMLKTVRSLVWPSTPLCAMRHAIARLLALNTCHNSRMLKAAVHVKSRISH
jgi:hypothetical protein